MVPFGTPVVPDVNMMHAVSSGDASSKDGHSGDALSPETDFLLTSMTETPDPSKILPKPSEQRAIVAPTLLTMCCNRDGG